MERFTWRLIVSGALPGSLNMALDEVLLEAVRQGRCPPLVRFYQWQRPTLSLGYAQSAARAVNGGFCQEKGIAVVRRITGGRSVLHHRELTYAVVSPEKNAIFPGGIQNNYRMIAAVLGHALRRFGIPAVLASGRGRVPVDTDDFRHHICFHAPSIHELTVAGRKVAGSAQTRRQGCFLQHGSLPLEMDLELLGGALGTTASHKEAFPELADSIGWINRFAAKPVAADDLREAIEEAIAALWQVRLEREAVTAAEMAQAVDLQRSKYENDAWTFGR